MFEQQSIMTKIGTVFLSWRRMKQKEITSQQITLKQLHVLKRLSQQEYLYPSDLAEAIYADRPTTTVVLNNLVKQGWIRREKDLGNKKKIRIYLTDAGREKLEEVNEEIIQNSKSISSTSCFTKEEVEQFHYLLNKLYRHFKEHNVVKDREEGSDE